MNDSSPSLRIEQLRKNRHDRSHFDAGVEPITTYLRRYARQNQDLGIGVTYVLTRDQDAEDSKKLPIFGFYTLATGHVESTRLPADKRKRLPRYPVPVLRMAQLGVDASQQGKGYGELLLVNALRRCARVSDEIGAYAIVVDALNDEVRSFYERYGFMSLAEDRNELFLPMQTAKNI